MKIVNVPVGSGTGSLILHDYSGDSLEFTGNWFVDAGKMIEVNYMFNFEVGENYDGRSVS